MLDALCSSLVLSDRQKKWILKQLHYNVLGIKLIYRASQHGWSPARFHQLCDRKGPTLTIMRSGAGRVFGGFTKEAWQSENGLYVEDEKAFIFSLDRQQIYRVQKPSGAIYCHTSWGPSFGGNALGVRSDPMNAINGSQCRTNGFGDGSFYQIRSDTTGNHEVTGEGKQQDDDKKEFTCYEIEVFELDLEL